MTARPFLFLFAVLSIAAAPPPDAATLAERAAKRFPQPVRVGDLVGRDVLEPVEAQPVLGRVAGVARRADGGLDLLLRRGGVLGLGARTIAVPLDAAALLGEHVAVIDLSPAQLDGLPAASTNPLPADTVIRMALVRPFH